MNFEYKTMKIPSSVTEDSSSFEDTLNQYGKNGWELVYANTYPHFGSSQYSLIGISAKTILIFKRPIS